MVSTDLREAKLMASGRSKPLSALALGQEVTIQTHGYDKSKRTFPDVLLPDGTNVNLELVKEGLCWWYRKYEPGERYWRQRHKRRKKVWTDPQPVPPRV